MFGNVQSAPGLPSILIVGDAHYTPTTKNQVMEGGLPITDAKMEIAVDRITAQGIPQTIECVPSGARFDFSITYKVLLDDNGQYDNDGLTQDLKSILLALEQIEAHTGLGGYISKGFGQVKFHLISLSL